MGNESKLNTRLKLLAVAVGLACSSMAGAAALGNISVQSGRGQPLQAEIELALANPAEVDGLVVKVYSPEEYWNPSSTPPETSLRNISARTERRPNGSYVVKVASPSLVDVQQVALLAEVSSSEGRSVREYIVPLPKIHSLVATDVKDQEPKSADVSVQVKSGDTLNKIARDNKPAEVSMERMLVALYRANPQAFSGKNMNRLKAGKVLRMPTEEELAMVTQPSARKTIHVQVADWNAYRQRLSAGVAAPANEESAQESSGKVGSAVSAQDAADKAPHQEVLKLSKGDAPGGEKAAAEVKSLKEKLHAMEEDLTAREQALQESKDRIAMLEKNNREMQRLLELKSAAVAPAEPAKLEELAQSAPEAVSAVEPSAPAAVEPVSAAPAVPESSVVEAEPAAAKAGSNVPKILWGGAAALLIGLGAFLFMRRNRKDKSAAKKPVQPAAMTSAPTLPDSSELLVSSAVAEEGAEALVDLTGEPLAEAEAEPVESVEPLVSPEPQVEAALKEEVSEQFSAAEFAVSEADEQAAKAAADLESGFSALDDFPGFVEPAPASVAQPVDVPVFEAPADVEAEVAVEQPAPAVSMDFDIPSFVSSKTPDIEQDSRADEPEILLDEEAESVMTEPVAATMQPVQEAVESQVLADDSEQVAASVQPSVVPSVMEVAQAVSPVVEDTHAPIPVEPVVESVSERSAVAESVLATPAAVPPPAVSAAAAVKPIEEVPLELDIPTIADFNPPETSSLPPMPGMEGVDLNMIDDTNLTEEELQAKGEHWLQVTTKLDLARAYQEMGDDAGAREILEEVLTEGDAEQKATAEQLLQLLPPA